MNLARNILKKLHIMPLPFWEVLILFVFFLIFLLEANYNYFGDEYDNMLGGKLITDGILPYRDYFSHHMPLPYYLGAVINLISGPSPLSVRYVFLIILYAWLLLFHKDLRKLTTPKISLFFIFLIALINPVIWSHMLLAETLIAYSAIHLAILVLKLQKEGRKDAQVSDIIQIAFVASIPVLSSLGFWALSLFYYLFFLIYFSRNHLSSKPINYRRFFKFLVVFGSLTIAPYILLSLHLYLSQSLNDFYLYNLIFNQEYYSIYNVDIPKTNTQMFIDVFIGIFNSLAINLKQLSDEPMAYYRLILRVFVYSYIALCFIMKKKAVGIFFLLSYFLLNVRQGDIYIVNNIHEIQTMLFSLLCIVLIIGQWFRASEVSDNSLGIKKFILMLNFSLLIILMGFLFSFDRDVLISYRNDNMPTLVKEETELNKIMNSSGADTVWIGPSKFDEYFFLKPKVASKYYFWFPWHNSCPSCKTEIMQDLKKNKPSIVYWDSNTYIWEQHWANDYGKSIHAYLVDNYTTEDNLIYRLKE